MDELNIYANVEELSENHSKLNRERSISGRIYENENTSLALELNKTGPAVSALGKSKTVKKRSCRATAVILGLLFLLFVGLLTLVILYTKGKMEMAQLQTSYNNLDKEKDQLQRKLENILQMHSDWVFFGGSFYYISSSKKSWKESRTDCQQRGADLMIINNPKEQEFAIKFEKRIWIGLTDKETEGTWKWVDGALLTTSYWVKSEPNNDGGNEHCAEVLNYDRENSWNDLPCDSQRFWICEKAVLY